MMKMIRNVAVLVGVLGLNLQAREAIDSLASVCSMSQACLGNAPAECTAEQLKPNSEIKYNVGFCDEAKTLIADGIQFQNPLARKPWIQLGRPLRIEYEESGILPLQNEAVEYLIRHLGLAVELVNAYRSSSYTLEFKNADSSFFVASNGKSLSGEFQFLTPKSTKGHNVLYGIGIAALPGPLSVLFGNGKSKVSLRGDALVFLDFAPRSDKTSWQMRLVVFPEDNSINKVMGMGIFRNKVSSYIQEIIGDISKSAQEYARGNRDPVAKSAKLKTPVLAAQLLEFETLLKSSQMNLK